MKKLLIIFICVFSCIETYSQNYETSNYVFEFSDSINLNKDELYGKSKLFVATVFNSAPDVIKLDDKENGILILKGIISIPFAPEKLRMQSDVTYDFTCKILFKDSKFKISISDVIYRDGYFNNGYMLPKGEYPGIWKCNMTKSSYEKLRNDLVLRFNSIISKYINVLKTTADNW